MGIFILMDILFNSSYRLDILNLFWAVCFGCGGAQILGGMQTFENFNPKVFFTPWLSLCFPCLRNNGLLFYSRTLYHLFHQKLFLSHFSLWNSISPSSSISASSSFMILLIWHTRLFVWTFKILHTSLVAFIFCLLLCDHT